MDDSATATRATERMRTTAAQLTAVCRRLTVDRGLTGFTIEEVCNEVGVSRRTFFNYFPSKEEAVLGIDENDEAERFAATFLERASRGWTAVIDDLAELGIDLAESMDLDATTHSEVIAAIASEPRLLARAIGVSRAREQQLVELIAQRESVDIADARAIAAVSIFSATMRSAMDLLMQPDSALDFRAAFTTSLSAIRDVLATPTDRKDHA